MRKQNIWLIGGDERQALLAGLFRDDGHEIHVYGLEQRLMGEDSINGIERADCIMFPLPALDAKGLINAPFSNLVLKPEHILDLLRPKQIILAGKPNNALQTMATLRSLEILDYFAEEELALFNAIPTAEGAIRIAMDYLSVTLHSARILILGFGRLGQALAPRLRGLGAVVEASARRSEQRALAESMGIGSQRPEELADWLHTYDLVINTVPAQILGVEELSRLKEGTPIIDLASLPGGVDDESAAALGVKVIHALSLPGREAPLTAARYLRNTVYHMLEGRE